MHATTPARHTDAGHCRRLAALSTLRHPQNVMKNEWTERYGSIMIPMSDTSNQMPNSLRIQGKPATYGQVYMTGGILEEFNGIEWSQIE